MKESFNFKKLNLIKQYFEPQNKEASILQGQDKQTNKSAKGILKGESQVSVLHQTKPTKN